MEGGDELSESGTLPEPRSKQTQADHPDDTDVSKDAIRDDEEVEIDVITAAKSIQDVVHTYIVVLESEILFGQNDQIYPKEIQSRNNLWNLAILGKFNQHSLFFDSLELGEDIVSRRLLEEPYIYISGALAGGGARTAGFTVETPRGLLVRTAGKKAGMLQARRGRMVSISQYHADKTFSSSVTPPSNRPKIFPRPMRVLMAETLDSAVSKIGTDDARRFLETLITAKNILFSSSGYFRGEALLASRGWISRQVRPPSRSKYKIGRLAQPGERTEIIGVLLKAFEKLGEPVVSPFEIALMGSAHKPWMARLYADLSLYGPKSSEVARDTAAELLWRENLTGKKLAANKKYHDQSLASQLSAVARKLFGSGGVARRQPRSDKAGPVASAGPTYRRVSADPEKVLQHLTEQERKAVWTVFENQKKVAEARMRNECKHVALVAALRQYPTSEYAGLISMLRPYLPEGESAAAPGLEFLACRQCGQSLMCPHFLRKITLEAMDKPPADATSQLEVFASESRRGRTFATFCKICGEILFPRRDEERIPEIAGRIGLADPELQKYVWFVAIDLSKLLKFETYTSNRKFATYVAQDVLPLILLAEERALRRGVKVDDVGELLSPRLKLYAIVFVYAYILNLIAAGGVRIAEVQGGAPFSPGKLSDSAAFLVRRITKRFGLEVSRISRQSDYVLNRFREAYKIVIDSGGKRTMVNPDPAQISRYLLTAVDVVYGYAAASYRLANKSPPKSSLFETLLGDVQTSRASQNLYADLYRPDGSSVSQADKPFQARYTSFATYLRGSPSVRMGDLGPFRAIFLEESRAFRNEDLAELRLRRKCCGPPFYDFHFTRIDRILPDVEITAIYGEDGHRHAWISGYKSGKIRKNIWERPTKTLCEICGVDKYHNKLDVGKTQKAYNLLTGISTFFRFYDSRCPEGDVHTFNARRCVKCGLTNELYEKARALNLDKDVRDYYTKYVDKYEQGKWRGRDGESSAPRDIPSETDPHDVKYVDSWEYDYAAAKKVAGILGVSVSALDALGMGGSRPRPQSAQPQTGTEPTRVSDFRIYLAAGMTGSMISSVTFFKNASRMSAGRSKKVDEFLNEFSAGGAARPGTKPARTADSARPGKMTYGELGKKLPDIGNELRFAQRFPIFLARRKPEEIRLFCVDQFSKAVLKTWEFSDVGKKLAEKLGTIALQRNTLFQAPDYDKLNLIRYGLRSVHGIDSTTGDAPPLDTGTDSEDVPPQGDDDSAGAYADAAADGVEVSQFSLENIDYDGHNDEPD